VRNRSTGNPPQYDVLAVDGVEIADTRGLGIRPRMAHAMASSRGAIIEE
jgi:hypothetical protein